MRKKYWYYLVSAKSVSGKSCFRDGLTENEALRMAMTWRESCLAFGETPIIAGTVEITAYMI